MPALLGGYELLSRIGSGGMAEVFLARKAGPEGFEKRVALKRILPHLAGQPDFVAMFLEEARLAARLDHPHIVHVHDFGLDGDDYYLAMEHVAGADLAALNRRSQERRIPIPLADAAGLLHAACEALHHAHEQGIIHRDVSPSNLLVSYEGVVKLADFGVAKAEARAAQAWSRAGVLKGKLGYMSPEQVSGRGIDRRSDVWSLGVCAWELATGRRLFSGDDERALLERVRAAEVPPPTSRRAVPPALEEILMRALAGDPDARFPTARAFGEALARWMAETRVPPSPARLEAHMTRLFGADAAERARAPEAPVEPTVRHENG
ncbi:MAG: serine/threonine-protein kinase [Polyangia bacterium]|jgi:serine/threonine-protein kinase